MGPVGASAARHLEEGGLLGHPTHGVYGLGGQRSGQCDSEIARLKARPSGRGLVCLVFNVAGARAEFPGAEWSAVAEKLAQPGEILVSEAVQRRVRAEAPLRFEGERQLSGREEPVHVYSVERDRKGSPATYEGSPVRQ